MPFRHLYASCPIARRSARGSTDPEIGTTVRPVLLMMLILVVWIALSAAWIAAIVSASSLNDEAFTAVGRSRTGTIVLVVLTGWIGALYYWIAIKPRLANRPASS
jgi:hypothetical protein